MDNTNLLRPPSDPTDELCNEDSVFSIVEKDESSKLKAFLAKGIDVDVCESNTRNSLLHLSILHGSYKCLVVLLNNGASINIKNRCGETCLQLAKKLRNRQGCVLAIQLAIRDRREKLKKGEKIQLMKEFDRERSEECNDNNAVNKSDVHLKTLKQALRVNIDNANTMVEHLEAETCRAKCLADNLQLQLQALEAKIEEIEKGDSNGYNSSQNSAQASTSGALRVNSCDFWCIICWDTPKGHILQCSEGHLFCRQCFANPQLDHCPQCRVSLDTCIRNRALESILSNGNSN